MGETARQSFIVTNTGGGVLQGAIASPSCGDFAVVAGGGSFTLAAGASRQVTVEFAPQSEGAQTCTITTGTDCGAVNIGGTGTIDPVCAVVPASLSLDFGDLVVGETARMSARVTNTGGGVLSGAVQLNACGAFSLVSGGGNYVLAAQETRTVEIEFAPSAGGDFSCTLTTGTGCGDVALVGEGVLPPACALDTSALAFGDLTVGETARQSFIVTNTGGGILFGTISIPPDFGFTLVSGAGAFQLAAGESRVVTVAFAPVQEGNYSCMVKTGTACGEVALAGEGVLPPACSVEPSALDFGLVTVRQASQRNLTVTNTGGGILAGEIAVNGVGFAVSQGAGPFALAGGDSLHIVVEFLPLDSGSFAGSVSTETPCGVIALAGEAEFLAEPRPVEPSSLDFGKVVVGTTSRMSFTVNNILEETVRGRIREYCPAFIRILAGAGDFVLPPHESLEVLVEFAPTETGPFSCRVNIGVDMHAAACLSMQITGEGIPAP